MSGETPHHPFRQRRDDTEETVGRVFDARFKNKKLGESTYEVSVTGSAPSGSSSGLDCLPLDGSLPMEGDLDMAQHMLLQAVFDSGTVFPTVPAPVVGQMFYRTDTGVLYICSSAGPPAVWTAVGGASGAPDDASYLIVGGADARLSNERVITPGTAIGIIDAGAGGALTINNTAPFVAHDILSAAHGDTTAAAAVKGDIITADGSATPKWIRKARGTDGQILTLKSSLVDWTTAIFPDDCAKGDLLVATSAHNWGVVAGAGLHDGYVFTWNTASGLPVWAAIPTQAGDHKVLASLADTTPKTLTEKILVGPSLTLTVASAGGDETITLDTIVPPSFTLAVQGDSHNPIASRTLYFGMNPKAPSPAAAINKIYIRRSCTLRVAELYCYAAAVAGSNEAWTIYARLNNTSDTAIATVGAAAAERVFSNAALSLALVAGDYLEIKSISPNWATAPQGVTFGGYLYFE
jgi:hypothetical protein